MPTAEKETGRVSQQQPPQRPASALYEYFIKKLTELDIHVESGEFGADMKVSLLNDGPVTIPLER